MNLCFQKMYFLRFSSFPEVYIYIVIYIYIYYFCWGTFFKMDFRRRPFNQKPLVFRKNPRTHLEVQGSFGDEGTFQECQKSWILKIPLFGETENLRRGVYFDIFRRRICFRSVLSCQNPWIAVWSKMCCSGVGGSQSFTREIHGYCPGTDKRRNFNLLCQWR